MVGHAGFLLGETPVSSLDEYAAGGGGAGLRRAREIGPAATIEEIRKSGLRGRGGAGFPTGVKWSGARRAEGETRYVVCNAAEGEPGTFKDRWLIRSNPYQLLEGIAIAAHAVGAGEAFIGIKAKSTTEIAALQLAAIEMADAGQLADCSITIVPGPDDYLFGEEKALLEAIEGRDPLPRLYPPYVQGLFEETTGSPKPTVVNNVETLSNVPRILREGADRFRSVGTARSPGTMVFTVGGDVRKETVVELEMGTPLSLLINDIGKGLRRGRRLNVVANGVSNRPLSAAELDTPMDFESLQGIGSGLGSGGFTVYDDTACVAQVAATLSSFLNNGSCGQCPPCKLGTGEITSRFGALASGDAGMRELEEIAAWSIRVTDSNRCGLGAGQQALARGFLETFPDHFAGHVAGAPCTPPRRVAAPVIEDWDPEAGRFRYRAS
jgi:NADH:ubiquinone oxidoreductase subunit F (NADH-binding)